MVINSVRPDINDDKGINLVMVHTERGKNLLRDIDMVVIETFSEDGLRGNSAYMDSVVSHPSRDEFFQSMKEGKCIGSIKKYLKTPQASGPFISRFAKRILGQRVYQAIRKNI